MKPCAKCARCQSGVVCEKLPDVKKRSRQTKISGLDPLQGQSRLTFQGLSPREQLGHWRNRQTRANLPKTDDKTGSPGDCQNP